jgi:hypothetical protein
VTKRKERAEANFMMAGEYLNEVLAVGVITWLPREI